MERRNGGRNFRPKIEIVRISSIERRNFRPLDGVQLRATYSHVRVGTYCAETETRTTACERKPPLELTRRYKKNLGPVSRLLRRRHRATWLASKSCDNIYSVNRSGNPLDWRFGQGVNERGGQTRQSNSSLDWRVGRSVSSGSSKLRWKGTTRSAEQLSRSGPGGPGESLTSDPLQTHGRKSKIVSLLRRLSPRLSRSASKGSMQSSPAICPWVQVEYSTTESIDGVTRQESQMAELESVTFERELRLNELRKRLAGVASVSQVIANVPADKRKEELSPRQRPVIEIQSPERDCNYRVIEA